MLIPIRRFSTQPRRGLRLMPNQLLLPLPLLLLFLLQLLLPPEVMHLCLQAAQQRQSLWRCNAVDSTREGRHRSRRVSMGPPPLSMLLVRQQYGELGLSGLLDRAHWSLSGPNVCLGQNVRH